MRYSLFFAFILAFLGSFMPEVMAVAFDPNQLFSAWGNGGSVTGVIGSNGGDLQQGTGKLIIYFIPKVSDALVTISAPVIFVMLIAAGFKYITAGDDEEKIKSSKEFFTYGTIGLLVIVLAYSILKAVYFLFA